jgi:hypothetical protein
LYFARLRKRSLCWSSPVGSRELQAGRSRCFDGWGPPGMHQWQTRSAHSRSCLKIIRAIIFRLTVLVFTGHLRRVSTDVKALLTWLGYFGDVSCDSGLSWMWMQSWSMLCSNTHPVRFLRRGSLGRPTQGIIHS